MDMRQAMVVFCVAAATAVPVWAQSGMKAGLWEVQSKMSGNPEMEAAMAKMQEQMKNMPPEQKKMMEEMMSRQGMSMNGNGMTMKVCITKEMAARSEVPVQHQGDCTSTRSPIVGNAMKISFNCTKPPSSGEGEITFGSDSYNMHMKMTAERRGKSETMEMTANGKYLGTDCGNIKPHVMPSSAPK